MKLRALFLIATLSSVPLHQAGAQTPLGNICVILGLDGTARVSALGAGGRPAEVGLGVGRNATLRTADGARATLQCNGGLRVVVGPGSEVTVLRILEQAPRTFRLGIMQGIAGFIFGNGDAGEEVQVRTPSAVAAVRSTEWAMQVASGASAIFAREGDVFVFGETGTARLGPGDGVDVSADGTVGAVVQWGQPRIDLFSELLGPAW
ncbi:FecR family protein [Palleronia pelagia]|uniref:FecR family protein n=1 Tax=Palleronia pelagia TaxID=387096 RepID=A0A1H8AK06_9RHOB|nr:FecR family protein [Palleronia pelagia]SEM70853.1 FecR family protein [Palleronia pelagia]